MSPCSNMAFMSASCCASELGGAAAAGAVAGAVAVGAEAEALNKHGGHAGRAKIELGRLYAAA